MKSRVVSDSIDHITATAVDEGAARVVPLGSVLVVVRSGILARTIPVARTASILAVNQDIKALIPHATVQPKYLQYFLESVEPALLKSVTRGATVHRLETPVLQGLPIPVPPLAEQERIVSILDEALDRIRLLQRRRRNISDSLGEFADSFLEAALAGGDTWPMVTLASTASLFADGDWVETKDQAASGVRLIQTGNIGFGEFKDRSEKARFVSRQTFKRLRCTEVLPGDCLVSRLPEPVGRSCVVPPLPGPMITAVDCTIIRFRPDAVVPGFFGLISQSASYLNQVERACTGTTRKRISRSNLGRILIPLPALEEQTRLVASVQRMEGQVRAAHGINSAHDSCLNELRASLLREAFTGGL
jgi:restriction endonuclease S subunit